MTRARTMKWIGLHASGAVALQITACLGPDPQFFIANVAAGTLISNLVTTIYQLVVGGLTGAA